MYLRAVLLRMKLVEVEEESVVERSGTSRALDSHRMCMWLWRELRKR